MMKGIYQGNAKRNTSLESKAPFESSEVFPGQERCLTPAENNRHCFCSVIFYIGPSGLTYSFQISEDRRVRPSGNPPGAWGTRHEWSTWGGQRERQNTTGQAAVQSRRVLQTHHDICQHKQNTECIFIDQNSSMSSEIFGGKSMSSCFSTWHSNRLIIRLLIHHSVIVKPQCGYLRRNWRENRHHTPSSLL